MTKASVAWPFLGFLPRPEDFHPEQALENRAEPVAGVYLLWSMDGRLVYIGQSSHILRRLGQHRGVLDSHGRILEVAATPEKEFQSATWTPVAEHSDRLRVESILILAALPTYNRAVSVGIAHDGVCYDSTRLNFGRASRARATRAAAAAKRKAQAAANRAGAAHVARPQKRLGPRTRG